MNKEETEQVLKALHERLSILEDTFVDNFCGMGKMSMMTDSTLKMLKKANNICKDILNPDSKDE